MLKPLEPLRNIEFVRESAVFDRIKTLLLAGLVAREAKDAFFGRDGDAAGLEEVGAEGAVFVEVNLGEAMGGVAVGEDDAAPEVLGVVPGDAEALVVVVALGDEIAAAEIADETADDGGVRHALIGNFGEFKRRHAAPRVEVPEFIRALEGWELEELWFRDRTVKKSAGS
jgi:hypothetical protein